MAPYSNFARRDPTRERAFGAGATGATKTSPRMYVLGLNYGSHDSSAAILRDGYIVFAAAEERFSRIKHDSSFPALAIEAGLRTLGINDSCIDSVVLSWPLDKSRWVHDLTLLMRREFPVTRERVVKTFKRAARSFGAQNRFIERYTAHRSQPRFGFAFCSHHYAHALSAFYLSPTERAAALVIDGRGTTEATTIWAMDFGVPRKLFERSFPASAGLMYSNVTQLLGFRPLSDEWKVMGLAAYGHPTVDFGPYLRRDSWEWIVAGEQFVSERRSELSKFEARHSNFHRTSHGDISQRHMDMAASVQSACERVVCGYAEGAAILSGTSTLCLAGGVALNCKAISTAVRMPQVASWTVQPAPADDGSAIGAAIFGWMRHGERLRREPSMSPYLGTSYTDAEIEAALRSFDLDPKLSDSLVNDVAALLAEDLLVGWFQGRMEFGPRALGNRSILANPRQVATRDRLNSAVKHREHWRPFAPAVMHEHGPQYFEAYEMSPHMTASFVATAYGRRTIPAVVHRDGTSRVQSVTELSNPLFYRLMHEFARRTGMHVLLNTSFNIRSEPIVETPVDAIRTFVASGLDALAIGRFIVMK